MGSCAAGIVDYKTDTGRMKISSVEMTVFDLLRYPQAAGGLDNVATAISDLGEKVNVEKLAAIAPAFERNVLQRAGYLLDRAGYCEKTESLHKYLSAQFSLSWVELQPAKKHPKDIEKIIGPSPQPVERNSRWHVIIRQHPEADE